MKPRPKKLKERCGHDGCKRRAKAKHECLTCEKLVPGHLETARDIVSFALEDE